MRRATRALGAALAVSEEAVSGFPAPVVGVAASGGSLYVGDLTGTVYRIPTT